MAELAWHKSELAYNQGMVTQKTLDMMLVKNLKTAINDLLCAGRIICNGNCKYADECDGLDFGDYECIIRKNLEGLGLWHEQE